MNFSSPQDRIYVPYLDLSGGLNTKKDAHALDRNQLAGSLNCWYAYGNVVSKRPGTAAIVTSSGSTGSGYAGRGLVVGRFNGKSYVVVQQNTNLYAAALTDTSWTNIGTVSASAGPIRAAQMFDPVAGKDTLFIVNGVDTPLAWHGPGTTATAVPTGAGNLPNNLAGTAPITPAFVATLGNNSLLFYSGEPTAPNAVYISNPEYPTQFTNNVTQSSSYGGTYYPALIGNNDGVDGGSITGLCSLGSAMIVYKEASIYGMTQTQLLGDFAFAVSQISTSVGCLSPRSIVAFDTFHCFLGIDGVYQVDGEATRCISTNVPTFFDSSLTGIAANITNRESAIAVRHGNRLLLFYNANASTTYTDQGLWFDFNKLDVDGFPTCGQMAGMNVGGAAGLRFASDDGNMVWTDGSADRTGKFGLGYADFGNPIQTTLFGKADLFEDVFGPDAALRQKQLATVSYLFAIPQYTSTESLTFLGSVTMDLLVGYSQAGAPISIVSPPFGSWGQNWGTLIWTSSGAATQFQLLALPAQDSAYGRVMQIGLQESSIYPWICLGYIVYLNSQEVSQ